VGRRTALCASRRKTSAVIAPEPVLLLPTVFIRLLRDVHFPRGLQRIIGRSARGGCLGPLALKNRAQEFK